MRTFDSMSFDARRRHGSAWKGPTFTQSRNCPGGAATRVPAEFLKMDDRGLIVPGDRADLVILTGQSAVRHSQHHQDRCCRLRRPVAEAIETRCTAGGVGAPCRSELSGRADATFFHVSRSGKRSTHFREACLRFDVLIFLGQRFPCPLTDKVRIGP